MFGPHTIFESLDDSHIKFNPLAFFFQGDKRGLSTKQEGTPEEAKAFISHHALSIFHHTPYPTPLIHFTFT